MATILRNESLQLDEVEFVKKGQVTIPKRLRDEHHISPGSKAVVISVNGAFLIVPGKPETPKLFDQLREGLGTENLTLDEMIMEMRRIRDTSDYEAEALSR